MRNLHVEAGAVVAHDERGLARAFVCSALNFRVRYACRVHPGAAEQIAQHNLHQISVCDAAAELIDVLKTYVR